MQASPINTPLMPPDLPSTNDWSPNESGKNCRNAVCNTDHSPRRNLSHSEPIKSAAIWIFVVLALAATRHMDGCLLGLFSDRTHSIGNSQENPINPVNPVNPVNNV